VSAASPPRRHAALAWSLRPPPQLRRPTPATDPDGVGGDALDAVLAEARGLGFLGPGPAGAHRAHAAAFTAALAGRPTGHGVDLGTGGGVPGLVLATALPGWAWDLVETAARRAAFLERAVDRLGLGDRVRVRHLRAEDLGRRPAERAGPDVVTARSFGPPAVTAECAAPLLRPGGLLLVSEPPAGGGDRWPAGGLGLLGLVLVERRPGPPALAVLRQDAPCPARYPRRPGLPAKRPLW
jgi:16S rRNA (guanine527-N7)-methyltransferase